MRGREYYDCEECCAVHQVMYLKKPGEKKERPMVACSYQGPLDLRRVRKAEDISANIHSRVNT